jgi:hypothetical protein
LFWSDGSSIRHFDVLANNKHGQNCTERKDSAFDGHLDAREECEFRPLCAFSMVIRLLGMNGIDDDTQPAICSGVCPFGNPVDGGT